MPGTENIQGGRPGLGRITQPSLSAPLGGTRPDWSGVNSAGREEPGLGILKEVLGITLRELSEKGKRNTV